MAHILVVDDEDHIRQLIATVLTLEGHEVETAIDGHQALLRTERRIPDCIVLDMAMPGMDGWRFLDELYRRGIRDQTRVVVASGLSECDWSAHSQFFLGKPFSAEGLIDVIEASLATEPSDLRRKLDRSDRLAELIGRMRGL